jgi:hypothetical protein
MKKLILSLVACAFTFSVIASEVQFATPTSDCPAKKGCGDKGKDGCGKDKKDGQEKKS